MKRFLRLLLAGCLALAPIVVPTNDVRAAASNQILHIWLCAPDVAGGVQGPRVVVNTSSTASPQPSYQTNSQGCALFNNADVGFFLSQGFTVGVNEGVIQQNAITANQSGTTSTLVLPAYAFIKYIIVEETAGNAITGGVNVGDSGSATRFLSGTAVGANANVVVVPTNLNGSSSTGVPTADTILVVAATSFNSASINVSVIYGYY